MKIILPGERPMSWNKMYSAQHWIVRKREAERVHALVRYQLYHDGYKPQGNLFDCPVDIIVTAYFKDRPLDSSNIAGKIYEDSLKEIIIKDDSPKYVKSMKTVSLVDKENPRVEIEIIPYETPVVQSK